ncbi:MAG TPA: hypothetical protein VF135_04160 [Terriglobales bacterium]
MRTLLVILVIGAVSVSATAQEPQASKPSTPQVKVNYLNVCTPSDVETAELTAALNRVPKTPTFAVDYEIAKGRSTASDDAVMAGQGAKMAEGPPSISRWVRIRKEFPENSPFSNTQYSFSVTEDRAAETLIFRLREAKDLLQLSISDTVASLENPAQAVAANTPADRIRIERFGKSSVVLARCPQADQSSYESVFQKASVILNTYRQLLAVRRIVPQDLPRETPATRRNRKPPAKP